MRYLSLDVVVGTVMVGLLVVRIFDVIPPPVWWLVLPCTVWVVYTVDHLLDGWKSKGKACIKRHYFHYKHRKPLLVIVFISSCTSLFLSLTYFTIDILLGAGLILIAAAFYFTAVFFKGSRASLLLQKELFIAFIYCLGICFTPLIWNTGYPGLVEMGFLTMIFLLAWFQGILAAWYELDQDQKDGHHSFVTLFGKESSKRFLQILYVIISMTGLLLLIYSDSLLMLFSACILLLINHILLACLSRQDIFGIGERYKWLSELAFWLPGFIFFL